MENKPLVIFIEGNIGSGKTTFLNLIKDSGYFDKKYCDKKIAYIFEPVNEWQEYRDKTGKDVLTHFYEDQQKYSFSFQLYVYMTRMKAIDNAIAEGAELLFVERSIFTDQKVFMNTLYQCNKVTDIEYKIYLDLFDWINQKLFYINYKFLYLQLSTEKCYERIKKRSRQAETIIEYDYLEQLNKNHDNWFKYMKHCDDNETDSNNCHDISDILVILDSDYNINDNNILYNYFHNIDSLIL